MSSIGFIIASNLREMRKTRGMNQKEVARILGGSQSTVSAFEKGERVPDIETLIRFCDIYSTDVNTILKNEYPRILGGDDSDNSEKTCDTSQVLEKENSQHTENIESVKLETCNVAGFDANPDGVENIFVPRVKAKLSAGSGSLQTCGEIEGYYAFRSDWIHKKGSAKHMVLMRVSGDSMFPTIENGDMALVDQSQADVIAGAIYAVGMDDAIVIKRLDKVPGKLVLVSDNRRLYSPLEIDMNDAGARASVRIIGRVLWWCREA